MFFKFLRIGFRNGLPLDCDRHILCETFVVVVRLDLSCSKIIPCTPSNRVGCYLLDRDHCSYGDKLITVTLWFIQFWVQLVYIQLPKDLKTDITAMTANRFLLSQWSSLSLHFNELPSDTVPSIYRTVNWKKSWFLISLGI